MTDFIGSCPILRVNGESLERLKLVMGLAGCDKIAGYTIDRKRDRMVFFRYNGHGDSTDFPAPMSANFCAEMAFQWLSGWEYPDEPDHDGDNSKGWLCYMEMWGHIEPYGYKAFLAVEPHWLQYGK